MEAAKKRALDAVLAQIQKDFGKGSVMMLNEESRVQCEVLSTGLICLDKATGVGGLPRGRIIEVFGPEQAGKTLLTLSTIAETQKNGGVCVFIDAEHAFDPNFAALNGVKIEELVLSQPDNAEQALSILEQFILSNAVDFVVVDSVAALVPKAELEGDFGDAQMGLQARLMSQAMRKLTALISKTRTCVVFINQMRDRIGVMFGNPKTTTGGNALKFYSSMRIEVSKSNATLTIKEKPTQITKSSGKIIKNKVAAPFGTFSYDIIPGEGISRLGDLIEQAIAINVIAKAGSWFSYGENKWQGKEDVRAFLLLSENKKVFDEINLRVREQIFLAK